MFEILAVQQPSSFNILARSDDQQINMALGYLQEA